MGSLVVRVLEKTSSKQQQQCSCDSHLQAGVAIERMIKCCVVSLLLVVVASEATPDIQLAGFDDLFKLATGSSASNGDEMQERSDRSLANTFPFNTSPDQNSRHSSGRQRNPARSQQNRRDKSVGAAAIAARASHVQDYLQSSRNPRQGSPASTFVLNPQSQRPVNDGFTLLAGLGTQPDQSSQNRNQGTSNIPNGASFQSQTRFASQQVAQNVNQGISTAPRQPDFSTNGVPSQSQNQFPSQQPFSNVKQGFGNTPKQPNFSPNGLPSQSQNPYISQQPSQNVNQGIRNAPRRTNFSPNGIASQSLSPIGFQQALQNVKQGLGNGPTQPNLSTNGVLSQTLKPFNSLAPSNSAGLGFPNFPTIALSPAFAFQDFNDIVFPEANPARRPAPAQRPAPSQNPVSARRPAPSQKPLTAR